jgi:S1-C subfamily serine protease
VALRAQPSPLKNNTHDSALPPGENSSVISRVYQSVKNSIVTITALSSGGSSGPSEDIGTGFFIDSKGDIATNAHVVNGQHTVSVTVGNHTFQGTVVGQDTMDDLAIVRIPPPPGTSPLPLGSAKDLYPGQLVIAIGNPFQLTSSVSAGIVSGLNRSMPAQNGRMMDGMVQTDAALNPGNSGGPLLNASGQVVGINTMIESPVQGSVGIGFAIPIDRLKRLEPQLLKGETVHHPWLGITALDVDPIMEQEVHLKLPVNQGILVMSVIKGGPAAAAGLHPDSSTGNKPVGDGDIITAVNGQPVATVSDLTSAIADDPVGTVVHLTVLRKGKPLTINIKLGPWPSKLPTQSQQSPKK